MKSIVGKNCAIVKWIRQILIVTPSLRVHWTSFQTIDQTILRSSRCQTHNVFVSRQLAVGFQTAAPTMFQRIETADFVSTRRLILHATLSSPLLA